MLTMLEDYIRRSKSPYTVDDLLRIIDRNHIITNENGFIVFAWVLDEFHVLCAYAAPGRSFRPLQKATEELARANKIKCIKFSTDRPKAFGRLFNGYKSIATIMEKRM